MFPDVADMDRDVIAYIYAAAGASHSLCTWLIWDNLSRQDTKFRNPNDDTNGSIEIDKKSSADGQDDGDENQSRLNNRKREDVYTIRFGNQPRTKEGFVFGTHGQADFVLPNSTSASARHCALTFDEKYELIVRDLGSKHGTKVIYGNFDEYDEWEVKEVRDQGRVRDWSARGPGITGGFHPIINIKDEIQFRIFAPKHDAQDEEYRRKVAKYREGSAPDELLEGMGIQSLPPTKGPTPTGAKVTDAKSQFWLKEIGEGGFGTVYYAWDVTTRDEYAMKQPRQRRRFTNQEWENEVKIIKSLDHVSTTTLNMQQYNFG